MRAALHLLALMVILTLALQLHFATHIAAPSSTTPGHSRAWQLATSDSPALRWPQQWINYGQTPSALKRAMPTTSEDDDAPHGGMDWKAIPAPYALYFARMKDVIEKYGNANFPTDQGKRLYGDLIMGITVNHDGQILGTEVRRSSGIPALDHQALLIASSAGPFGVFPEDIRKTADQLAFTTVFRFTRSSGMSITLPQLP